MLAERQIQCRQLSADNDRLLVSALLEFPGRPIMLTRAAWVLRQKGISATTDAAFKEMLTARGQAQDALALLDIDAPALNVTRAFPHDVQHVAHPPAVLICKGAPPLRCCGVETEPQPRSQLSISGRQSARRRR
jgi:hypothetical protein